MDTLYPNLYERFKTEGLCPICLMEMELTPRYSCINGHTVCHRCKPYYYGCPTCTAPLDVEIPPPSPPPPPQMNAPQPVVHLMPYPMPRHRHSDHSPSAPPMNDFLSNESRRAWEPPPVPAENQHLESCPYSHLGCWVKVPEHLRALHESRCQFRPRLEEEHVPTDLPHGHDDLVECSYSAAGCRVRTVPWRRSIHEKYCIYKDKFQDVNDISDSLASATISGGDPEELVHCKFRRHGCVVNMPRRRKYIHEQKCNYKSQGSVDDDFYYPSQPEPEPEPELDPDEQVECRWSEFGCRVRPKRCREQIHEDKCNYRMEECMWKRYGCSAIFKPALRYSHENSCDFAHH